VKFLIDNALSPEVADRLTIAGHDALHVRQLGLATAADSVIFDLAAGEDRVLVSADTDFGTLLAMRRSMRPSVILFRHGVQYRALLHASFILDHLAVIHDALDDGALVTIEPTRIRIRELPLL